MTHRCTGSLAKPDTRQVHLQVFRKRGGGRITIVACGKIRADNFAKFHSAARTPRTPRAVDQKEVTAMAGILAGMPKPG